MPGIKSLHDLVDDLLHDGRGLALGLVVGVAVVGRVLRGLALGHRLLDLAGRVLRGHDLLEGGHLARVEVVDELAHLGHVVHDHRVGGGDVGLALRAVDLGKESQSYSLISHVLLKTLFRGYMTTLF